MFEWQYLKLRRKLEINRDEARAIHVLARLVRCMPGAVAQVGPCSDALLTLLATAVGTQREILVFDEAESDTTPLALARMSTLPGLQESRQPVYGITRIGLDSHAALRADLRYCFVHVSEADALRLADTVGFFRARLAPFGMMLVRLGAGADGIVARAVVEDSLAGHDDKLLHLASGYGLILKAPAARSPLHAVPAMFSRDRVSHVS